MGTLIERIKDKEDDVELQGFYKYLIDVGHTATTINTYMTNIYRVKHWLRKDLFDVTRDELNSVRRSIAFKLTKGTIKKSTYSGYIATIRVFYIDYWREHFRGKKALLIAQKKDKLFKYMKDRGRLWAPTREQWQVIKQVLTEDENPIWLPFYTLAYDTGLRNIETRYAILDNINRKHVYYEVLEPFIGKRRVDGVTFKYFNRPDMDRKPPISKGTIELLDDWMKIRPEPSSPDYKDLIFLDNRTLKAFSKTAGEQKNKRLGMPLYKELVERKFKDVLELSKARDPGLNWKDFVMHDLRGSFITQQVLNKVPESVICQWVGHKNSETIKGYIRGIQHLLVDKGWKGADSL